MKIQFEIRSQNLNLQYTQQGKQTKIKYDKIQKKIKTNIMQNNIYMIAIFQNIVIDIIFVFRF